MAKTRAAGGGRKPLNPVEKTTSRNVTLLPSQVEELERVGDGNLSAGIRKASDMSTVFSHIDKALNMWGGRVVVRRKEQAYEAAIQTESGEVNALIGISEGRTLDEALLHLNLQSVFAILEEGPKTARSSI